MLCMLHIESILMIAIDVTIVEYYLMNEQEKRCNACLLVRSIEHEKTFA